MAGRMTEFAAQRAEVNAVPAAVKRPRLYMPLILRLGGIRWLTPIRLFFIVGSVTCLTSWALKMPLATAVNTSYGIAIINYSDQEGGGAPQVFENDRDWNDIPGSPFSASGNDDDFVLRSHGYLFIPRREHGHSA